MADPTPIRAVERQPREAVVEILERALADAKAGKLVSLALVGLYEDGMLEAMAETSKNVYRLLGGLEALKLKIWERDVER